MCLIVGARHQGEASDAGRKAEIIFDAGGGAGLAAEAAAVEHDSGQPFGRGIHRGGKPGGPGADHGNVIDAVWINRADQPDAACQFVLGWITQQLPAGAEHDRQLPGIDMETLDQGLGFGVDVGVEQLLRLTVTAQKDLQPQHVAIVGAADDDRAAGAGLQQPDAADDQGPHDALAELGFGNQQGAQPVRRDDQGLHRLLRGDVCQRRPSGQLRELTYEFAGTVADNADALAGFIDMGHVDPAGQNDHQARADLADGEERCALGEGAALAEAAHALDLQCIEHRQHLLAALFYDRWSRCHDDPRPAIPVLRIYSQAKYCPPFAVKVEPVISPASSDARNTTQRAISSGSPSRPIGISGRMLFSSTSLGTACTISVLM